MFRFVCFLAFVAACNAGVATYNGQHIIAPTVTSEQQNVLRSYGNLQQVSYNSKTIDTPYSSVSKSDVRVSNPGYQVHKPIAYAAAPAAYVHQQPAAYVHQQPAAYIQQQPAYVHSSPVVHHQSPIVHQAPLVHSAPVIHQAQPAYSAYSAHAAPAVQKTLLGVAYSPSNVVSHMSYSAPLVSYAW